MALIMQKQVDITRLKNSEWFSQTLLDFLHYRNVKVNKTFRAQLQQQQLFQSRSPSALDLPPQPSTPRKVPLLWMIEYYCIDILQHSIILILMTFTFPPHCFQLLPVPAPPLLQHLGPLPFQPKKPPPPRRRWCQFFRSFSSSAYWFFVVVDSGASSQGTIGVHWVWEEIG